MKKLNLYICLVMLTGGMVYADGHKKYSKQNSLSPQNPLYINECASCHTAYQAEFLPKRSWKKIMAGLEDHFGVDATVEKSDYDKLLKYLTSNASDAKKVYGEHSKFARSISKGSTPLRISEIPKFKREHREIPKRWIVQKEVKSIANCTACHIGMDRGDYENIKIPNYGRWDD